ncbi:hypothetical protein ACIOGZ_41170 [Kitasatospora sp. NPDC088160]|uniref:hypothetical protein n=1 Tax=Kitasatospora sp. NPDC088160 TaxID=3364072 RepID=UPI0038030F94
MALDVSSRIGSGPAMPVMAVTAPSERVDREHERLLEKFNQAVRHPEEFGGLSTVASLLDRIAVSEPRTAGSVWIPDTNARLAPSAMLRGAFPDSDIYVIASQYGEDAHRRGWLRLDRTLTPAEHSVVVDGAVAWSETDRSLPEIVAEFGPPSVTFGPQAPRRPKTLTYATADRAAPVVAFHLGAAQAEPSAEEQMPASAALLAVRVHDDFFDGWELTPFGLDRFH